MTPEPDFVKRSDLDRLVEEERLFIETLVPLEEETLGLIEISSPYYESMTVHREGIVGGVEEELIESGEVIETEKGWVSRTVYAVHDGRVSEMVLDGEYKLHSRLLMPRNPLEGTGFNIVGKMIDPEKLHLFRGENYEERISRAYCEVTDRYNEMIESDAIVWGAHCDMARRVKDYSLQKKIGSFLVLLDGRLNGGDESVGDLLALFLLKAAEMGKRSRINNVMELLGGDRFAGLKEALLSAVSEDELSGIHKHAMP